MYWPPRHLIHFFGKMAATRLTPGRSTVTHQCQTLMFTAVPQSFRKRVVPLFYFDIDDGHLLADLSGHDLPDLDAARTKALELANPALAVSLRAWHDRRWTLDVYDMMGLPLFKIATGVHTGFRIESSA